MDSPQALKVVIRSPEGKYLAGSALGWEFTEDRTRARVFDYLEDRVAEQLEMVRRAYGTNWVAVGVDPREVYEVCDRCGHRMMSFKIFFDGTQYLCRDCRDQAG